MLEAADRGWEGVEEGGQAGEAQGSPGQLLAALVPEVMDKLGRGRWGTETRNWERTFTHIAIVLET